MTMKIEIRNAARVNPDSDAGKPWNIYKNGVLTNTTPNLGSAQEAVRKLFIKHGLSLDGLNGACIPTKAEGRKQHNSIKPSLNKPRGAPNLGDKVRWTRPFSQDVVEGVVIEYLSEQFVVKHKDGTNSVLFAKEPWQKI